MAFNRSARRVAFTGSLAAGLSALYVLVYLGWVPGIEGEVPLSAFLILFLVIWLVVWVWTNGPMRIFNLRWRFFGGRLV